MCGNASMTDMRAPLPGAELPGVSMKTADEEEGEDDSGADDDSDDSETDRPVSPATAPRALPRPPAAGGRRGHAPLHEPPKTARAPLQAGRQASGQVGRGGAAHWVC